MIDIATPIATVRAPSSRQRRAPRVRLRLDPLQALGFLMVLAVAAFAVVVPMTAGYDPMTQDLRSVALPPGADPAHPLGTDVLGRDLASRLALASQVTLGIALLVVLCTALIGMTLGIVSGFVGGRVDSVIMGFADIQLAIPVIMLVIALAAAVGPNVGLMILVLILTLWVNYARVTRSLTLTLRERDFVLAPQIMGASRWWAMRKHIVPNVTVQLVIVASAEIGAVILATSAFDYLGLGVQAPTPSWGSMISEGQKFFRESPHLALIPGLMIVLIVVGVNLISQRFTAENGSGVSRRRGRGRR